MADDNMLAIGATSVRVSPTTGALAAALAKAQAEMRNPAKEASNPHFGSKYADLASVRDAVLPALNANGLSVLQFPCDIGELPGLLTILLHTSGERVESVIRLRSPKTDPQGVGSALTYMRRYSLQSLGGVAGEADDDGNAASAPSKPQQQPARRQQSTPAPPTQPPAAEPAQPPAPVVTSDDVFNLLDECAEREGVSTESLVAALLANVKSNPASLDDMTPGELRNAAAAVRKRIASLPPPKQLPGMSDAKAPANPATMRH